MLLIPYVQTALRVAGLIFSVARVMVISLTALSLVAISIGLLIGLLFGAMLTGCNATLEAVNGKPLLKKVR